MATTGSLWPTRSTLTRTYRSSSAKELLVLRTRPSARSAACGRLARRSRPALWAPLRRCNGPAGGGRISARLVGARSPAGEAEAEYVQAVAVRFEALGIGELADGAGHLLLEAVRQGDVGDLPAADAQQVVVMLGEVLGQLETGELVTGRDPADQAGRMQVGQVPVGRAGARRCPRCSRGGRR